MLDKKALSDFIIAVRQLGGTFSGEGDDVFLHLPHGPTADELRASFGKHAPAIAQLRASKSEPSRLGAPVSQQRSFPIHSCQQGIYHSKIVSDALPQNCCFAYLVRGGLRADDLAEAYRAAMARYSALFMKLDVGSDNEPRWHLEQDCLVEIDIDPRQQSLNLHDDDSFIEYARKAASDLSLERFNTGVGPVGRISLLPLSDEVLLIVEAFDHLLVDGASLTLLHQAVASGTTINASSFEGDLYPDFLSGTPSLASVTFWEQMFSGFQHVSVTPGGKNLETLHAIVDAASIRKLDVFGRSIGASIADISFAAHCHAVARLNGVSDICTFNVRNLRSGDQELMFGHATQVVPIRVTHLWQETASCHIKRIALELARVRDNCPFPNNEVRRLTGVLGAQDPAANVFAFQDAPVLPPRFQGMVTEEISLESLYTSAGLTTICQARPNGTLKIGVSVRSDDAGAPFGKRVLELMVDFLCAITTTPDAPLGSADYLPEKDRHVIKEAGARAPDSAYRDISVEMSAGLTRDSQSVALWENGKSITKSNLKKCVAQIRAGLQALRIPRNSCVVVSTQSNERRIAAYIAVLDLHLVYVPIGTTAVDDHVATVLDLCGAAALITEESILPTGIVSDPNDWKFSQVAYVIFTSGTTGVPKGVVIGRDALSNFAYGELDRFAINSSSRVLLIAPPEVDPWIAHVSGAMIAGAALYCADPAKEDLSEFIETHQITHAFLPAALLGTLSPSKLTGLTLLATAGDKCNEESVRQLLSVVPQLINIYGPTEATISALTHKISHVNGPVPIGTPISGLAAQVLIDGVAVAPLGAPGELCLTGTGVGLGYLNSSDSGFYIADGVRGFRTGDLATVGDDGLFHIRGRLDRQIKIRGYRVELDSIERFALTCDGVIEARAIVTGNGDRRKIVLFYCGNVTPAFVQRYLRNSLPSYSFPHSVEWLPQFPLTGAGKPDDRALSALGEITGTGALLEEVCHATRSFIESWHKVFRRSPLLNEDFFESGGDSLSALVFVRSMGDKGYELSPSDLYRNSTVATLIKFVKSKETPSEPRSSDEPPPHSPLLPMQAWYYSQSFERPERWCQRIIFDCGENSDPNTVTRAMGILTSRFPILSALISEDGLKWTSDGNEATSAFLLVSDSDVPIEESVELALNWISPAIGRNIAGVLTSERFLILFIHHLVVDEWSLEQIHECLKSCFSPSTPSTTQQRDLMAFSYATAMEKRYSSGAFDLEIDAWNKTLQSGRTARRAKLTSQPEYFEFAMNFNVADFCAVHRVSRSAVFLAMLASTLEGSDSTIVDLEVNGRLSSPGTDLSRSVGWLSTHFPIILPKTNFSKELIDWMDRQISSIPDQGAGYVALRYCHGRIAEGNVGAFSVNISELDLFDKIPKSPNDELIRALDCNGRGVIFLPYEASFIFKVSAAGVTLCCHHSASAFAGTTKDMFLERLQSVLDTSRSLARNGIVPLVDLPFEAPIPVSRMQSLMLKAASIGDDVYRPKLVVRLERRGHSKDVVAKSLGNALANFPAFRWRFHKDSDGKIMQYMAPPQTDGLSIAEGNLETAQKWFDIPDHLKAADVLAGRRVMLAHLIVSESFFYVCLQFHHAVIDGASSREIIYLLKEAAYLQPKGNYDKSAASTASSIRKHIGSELRALQDTASDRSLLRNEDFSKPDGSFAVISNFTVGPEIIQSLRTAGAKNGYSLKVLVMAAVASWLSATGLAKAMAIVENGRDPSFSELSNAHGLYWYFCEFCRLDRDPVENLMIAQRLVEQSIDSVRTQPQEFLSRPDTASFNYTADDLGVKEDVICYSRDRFHFPLQVQARLSNGDILTIGVETCGLEEIKRVSVSKQLLQNFAILQAKLA